MPTSWCFGRHLVFEAIKQVVLQRLIVLCFVHNYKLLKLIYKL